MGSLLTWYLGGVLLFGLIAAMAAVTHRATNPPHAFARSAAVLAIAGLWPLMLAGLAQLLLIRTTARAFGRHSRHAPHPVAALALAGRR